MYFIGGKERHAYPTCYISSFFYFFIFYLKRLYIGEEGKNNTMDHLERRGRFLVVFGFILVFALDCETCA